jgi:hypothetical protein
MFKFLSKFYNISFSLFQYFIILILTSKETIKIIHQIKAIKTKQIIKQSFYVIASSIHQIFILYLFFSF